MDDDFAFSIQTGSAEPIYRQLIDHVRRRVASGQILLDDVDISSVDLAELRARFALVPQESVIFATSVLENVRYGRPEATEQEVIAACIAARADSFIREFSDGYATQLGERGVRLSGGQKQRIAIARAILADRPVLLLDEATSALDDKTEANILRTIKSLNITLITVAHRMLSAQLSDFVLVLEKGAIVQQGTPQSLSKIDGYYRNLLLSEESAAQS